MIFCFNAKEFKLSVKYFLSYFSKKTVISVTFVKCKIPLWLVYGWTDWPSPDFNKRFSNNYTSLANSTSFSLLPFLLLSGRILSNNWMDLLPNSSIKDRLRINEENDEYDIDRWDVLSQHWTLNYQHCKSVTAWSQFTWRSQHDCDWLQCQPGIVMLISSHLSHLSQSYSHLTSHHQSAGTVVRLGKLSIQIAFLPFLSFSYLEESWNVLKTHTKTYLSSDLISDHFRRL